MKLFNKKQNRKKEKEKKRRKKLIWTCVHRSGCRSFAHPWLCAAVLLILSLLTIPYPAQMTPPSDRLWLRATSNHIRSLVAGGACVCANPDSQTAVLVRLVLVLFWACISRPNDISNSGPCLSFISRNHNQPVKRREFVQQLF